MRQNQHIAVTTFAETLAVKNVMFRSEHSRKSSQSEASITPKNNNKKKKLTINL